MKKSLLSGITLFLLLLASLMTFAACKSVENVALDKNNQPQTVYVLGNELDLSKGKLNVDGNLVALNAEGVTVSGYDKNTLGEQTITVTYAEKTVQYTVTVVPRFRAAETYVYFIGESLTDAQPRLNITRDDGTPFTVSAGDAALTITGFDSTQANEALSLSVVYDKDGEHYEGTFEVAVVEPKVTFVKPRKLSYGSHETELSLVGASLRLSSPDGKTTRNVSYSELTTTGFEPAAVTADNPTATQTITVSYRGREVATFEVTVDYSDVSQFKDAAKQLSALNWACYRYPTADDPGMAYPAKATTEMKELSVEMLNMYYGFSSSKTSYITQAELEAVARLAVVYGYNTWLETVERAFSGVFAIDEVGELTYLCATREAAENGAAKIRNKEDPDMQQLTLLADMLDNGILDAKCANTRIYSPTVIEDETLDVDLTIPSLASVIPEASYLNRVGEVLEWAVEAHDALGAVETEWTVDDLKALPEGTIDDVYQTLTEINARDTGNTTIYPLLNGWREKEDFFEILYRYYYADMIENDSASSLRRIDNLSAMMFPVPLEELRVTYTYGQSAQTLLQAYKDSYDPSSGELPELVESTLLLYLYEQASDQAETILALNDDMYTFLYTLYYAPILSEMLTGSCGYLELRGASAYDEAVQAIWNDYFDLWMKYSEDPTYVDTDEFGTKTRAMFEAFVNLMPNQQMFFIQSLYYLYPDLPASGLYPDHDTLFSDFATFIYTYYLTELKVDITSEDANTAYDVFTSLLLALEWYANGDIENFCEWMQEAQTAYNGTWEGTSKETFDSYLGFFYNRYVTLFNRFEEKTVEGSDGQTSTEWVYKEVSLGDAQTNFEKLADAIDGTSLAKTYIEDLTDFMDPVALYLPFLASYERVRIYAGEILANEDQNIKDAYYFMPYGEGNYKEPLYYSVYVADDAYTRYLATLGIEKTKYEEATALRKFLSDYADYFWTVSKAMGIPYIGTEFDFNNAQTVSDMLKAFYSLSSDEQVLLLSVDSLNLFHGGLETAAKQLLFADNKDMQTLVVRLLNVQIAYIAYQQDPDGSSTGEDGVTTTTYLEDLLNLWKQTSALYEQLKADETQTEAFAKFEGCFGDMYNHYAEICSELSQP